MFNDQRHHLIAPDALATLAAAGRAGGAGDMALLPLPDLKAKMGNVMRQDYRDTMAKIAAGLRIDGQDTYNPDAPGGDCMEGCNGKVVLLHAGGVSYVMVTGPIFTADCWECYASKGVVMSDVIRACDAAAGAATSRAVLLIDSPGGNAMGMEDVVAAVRRLKAAKPLTALALGMMCSGAYMLGCLADAVYATRMSIVGSLGAVRGAPLYDDSKALEMGGVRREIVQVPGNLKVVTPGPIDDALLEAERTLLAEHAYLPFRDVVVEGRAGLTADMIDELGGAMFAARQALEHGLIDGIVVPSVFVQGETLAARAGGEASLQRCRQGASIMAEVKKPVDLAGLSVADILAARPDILDEAKKALTADVTTQIRAELAKTAQQAATPAELAKICGDDAAGKAMAFDLLSAGASILAAKDHMIAHLRGVATQATQQASELAKVAARVNVETVAVAGAATGADNDEFAGAKAFIKAEMGKGKNYAEALANAYTGIPGLREKHLKARVPSLA